MLTGKHPRSGPRGKITLHHRARCPPRRRFAPYGAATATANTHCQKPPARRTPPRCRTASPPGGTRPQRPKKLRNGKPAEAKAAPRTPTPPQHSCCHARRIQNRKDMECSRPPARRHSRIKALIPIQRQGAGTAQPAGCRRTQRPTGQPPQPTARNYAGLGPPGPRPLQRGRARTRPGAGQAAATGLRRPKSQTSYPSGPPSKSETLPFAPL
mmetsp:Transcript_101082/g.231876  ORF Transcript_101082/g.231876 Transcript_101082/m.231876 type:complete len:212 (+) Transcript_101082:2454-3089(+)